MLAGLSSVSMSISTFSVSSFGIPLQLSDESSVIKQLFHLHSKNETCKYEMLLTYELKSHQKNDIL